VENPVLAAAFDELADLLELRGESAFKVRAYRSFADAVRELDEPLAEIVARGELERVRGVGKAIGTKVAELLESGTFATLERERARVPTTLRDLLRVSGLGLKSVRRLWDELGIGSLGEVVDACERGDVAKLPRFGEKKQEAIYQSARRLLGRPIARVLADASATGARIAGAVARTPATEAMLVGEARRGEELVSDVLVLACGVTAEVARELLSREGVAMIERPGIVSLRLERGERARVRVVPEDRWVQSLFVETGPRAHVRTLEERAGGAAAFAELCAGAGSEDEVYATLGLAPVPPEVRELEAPPSAEGLVAMSDVRGVFHVHTTWSDGKSSLEEMVSAAKSAGFGFIGISEHSKAASYAGGLDRTRLLQQKEEVARLRAARADIQVLHGIEVDVLADGTLDLDDEVLAGLDFVIASVHTDHDMPAEQMTARILRAVRHPLVTILGHPTGRLLLAKPPFEFDLEAVARAAAENDTYLEINANAQRLDLAPDMIRRARAAGARFAINPDAHEPEGFSHVPFGVLTARRAGLSASDVLNACDAGTIRERLRLRRERARQRM
jgi:DNA polymerase (family 10)